MKSLERELVRQLRREGLSLNEILRQVPVSKSSASLWVRDLALTPLQIDRLRQRSDHRAAGRELFREALRAQREARWAQFHREAAAEYEGLRHDAEFMFGLALYIGEGSKVGDSRISLVNCDPGVIAKTVRFFEFIGVPRHKITMSIHLHPGLDEAAARQHWQAVTQLPFEQFRRSVWVVSRASTGKKGRLQPLGTCHVETHCTCLKQKLNVWMALSLYGRFPATPQPNR